MLVFVVVKRKHLEYVPSHLTEAEFWTRFFQSHYFHRDRINFSNKDLFAECAQNDDKGMLPSIWMYHNSSVDFVWKLDAVNINLYYRNRAGVISACSGCVIGSHCYE